VKSKILSFFITRGLQIGGFFIFLISLIVLNNGVVRKVITEENRVVSAKVLETPLDCDNLRRRGGYYKLEMNGQIFVKSGNRLLCEQVFGKEKVDILTNSEMDKIVFLNEYENSNDFLSGTLLMLFGIAIAYKGWKNKRLLVKN